MHSSIDLSRAVVDKAGFPEIDLQARSCPSHFCRPQIRKATENRASTWHAEMPSSFLSHPRAEGRLSRLCAPVWGVLACARQGHFRRDRPPSGRRGETARSSIEAPRPSIAPAHSPRLLGARCPLAAPHACVRPRPQAAVRGHGPPDSQPWRPTSDHELQQHARRDHGGISHSRKARRGERADSSSSAAIRGRGLGPHVPRFPVRRRRGDKGLHSGLPESARRGGSRGGGGRGADAVTVGGRRRVVFSFLSELSRYLCR